LRRLVAPLALAAALSLAASSAAGLTPVRRTFGDVTLPRLRAGTIKIPAGHADGRIRVIVDLRLAPLAAAWGRTTQAFGGTRRLNVVSSYSRAYLRQIDAEQRAAVAQLHRAIPEARVGRRFRILLDGLTVTLPAKRLPQLVRLSSVRHVYSSLRYTLTSDPSPTVIGADRLQATTGATGAGIKIGVVDDGIDQTNPYLSPTGFSYPAGFPKGNTAFTTPKVIVAKSFPGPNSGAVGALPLDRNASFHGTHVSGIAAGDAGTNAPAGRDHPAVSGLSGVAPRAWLGNYRVFTVPTPVGHVANTPEIVAAFEAAVADGMNVINFSGGGPQTDPANDAMIETIQNVVAAGVVPVIAAGNDRDDFGAGTVGSPGVAPDAITVAAVSNSVVYAPTLSVQNLDAPANVQAIPFQSGDAPSSWATVDHTLVDVTSVTGTDGKPVEAHLCGPAGNPNGATTTLPPGSLTGTIVLASRGQCAFVVKSQHAQAAGAIGIVLVDNRPSEANPIPVQLGIPSGMIADLDGVHLRAFMAGHGGKATIRAGGDTQQIVTGRSGVITSFSSAGPTEWGHLLKPDISAPGGQILSSTLPEFAQGSSFAVFDGTSMATPHIAGAAALLLQLHSGWTPQEVKSALMSTAGPAWGNTARTVEAPVWQEGGGLADLTTATDPRLFTAPASLSYPDLNVNSGAQSKGQLVRLTDAGGGAGAWQVTLSPQSASAGTTIDVPGQISVPPGGEADLSVVASASASAVAGDDYGFVVLTQGAVSRRIPYGFSVTRPGLAGDAVLPLHQFQVGTTVGAGSRVSAYRYPSAPFGLGADYTDAPMQEDGAEKVYTILLQSPVANVGVSVVDASSGAVIDPFMLGSLDENDVQGYAGTPVDVNNLTFGYPLDVGAAAAVFPRAQAFYVSVDSRRDPFTGKLYAGQYLLRSWINDVTPPAVQLLTTTVAAGRPTLVFRTLDAGSGVDPLSLAIGYKNITVGAAGYDPASGLAVFPLPAAAPKLAVGKIQPIVESGDYEETKNVNTVGDNIMPNTTFKRVAIKVVAGPAVTWIGPPAGICASGVERLAVAASSTAAVRSVRFLDGAKKIGTKTKGTLGLYAINWPAKGRAKGKHTLHAVLTDAKGRTSSASMAVRTCK
jgi:minor extracellular serine protease Vpr